MLDDNKKHTLLPNIKYWQNPVAVSSLVSTEIQNGLALLNSVQVPIVSIFGSARARSDSAVFQSSLRIAEEISKRNFALMTGGGPGVMQAANRAALESGGISIGIGASLLDAELINEPIYSHRINCQYMFVRRFLLSIKSSLLLFFPGGFGTFDELFEFVMLMQTKIVERRPIVCVGENFWSGLFQWIMDEVHLKNAYVGAEDLKLITIVRDYQEALTLMEERYANRHA